MLKKREAATTSTRRTDLDDETDDDLRRWWKDYQREFNSKWGSMEAKIDRRAGSKYDDLFKDMTKEEISKWIAESDLHRQMKKKLRRRYL